MTNKVLDALQRARAQLKDSARTTSLEENPSILDDLQAVNKAIDSFGLTRWSDNPKGQICNLCAKWEWSCKCYPIKCAKVNCSCDYDHY